MALDEGSILDALRNVDDPEAGMSVVDLGLVYSVGIVDNIVRVDMTMTTPACPVADVITREAHDAIAAIAPPGTDIQVRLVWEPIWNPSMMSDAARERFGWPG